MRMNHLARVLMLALAVVVTGATQGQSRDAAIKAALKKIESGQPKDMSAGRIDLADVYNRETSAAGKSAAAGDLVKLCTPAIGKLDGARAVQLAMAVAAVHDAAIQPTLEVMVGHKDAAVRLLGWRGYLWTDPENRTDVLGVREQIILQNAAGAATMWKTLAARMGKENSSAVFGPMFEMMRLPTALRKSTGPAVDAANFELLGKAWKGVCQKIVDGDEEMTRSARSAIMTLEYFHRTGTPATQNKVVGYLVEMMYCTAKSYDLESAEGDLAETAKQLAIDTDAMLGSLTGKKLDQSLAKALKEAAPGPSVVVVAYEWGDVCKVDMDAVKKAYQPKYRTKVTTRPATQPAPAEAE